VIGKGRGKARKLKSAGNQKRIATLKGGGFENGRGCKQESAIDVKSGKREVAASVQKRK